MTFLRHNDILEPILSGLASNPLILVKNWKYATKSVCCQLTKKMQIHGQLFAGRPIQIIHYLMVSSACMDS